MRREILERIRNDREGKWFEFLTPDYDLGWTVALYVESFCICERPFSITGVSTRSNSYSVRSYHRRIDYLERWYMESKVLDGWGLADPFYATLPMAVLGFRNAFCSKYRISVPLNLQNFIGTLVNSLLNQEDEESFQIHKE